jgi:hypothetical protein
MNPLTDTIVDIEHELDPNKYIPFINAPAPLFKVEVPKVWATTISELGFKVTAYDVTAEEAVVEVEAVLEVPAEKVELSVEAPVEKEEVVAAPDANTESDQSTQDAQNVEGSEEDQDIHLTPEEEAAYLDKLRAEVNGFKQSQEALEFITKHQIVIDPIPTRLKDIKAALLDIINSPS